MSSAVVFAASLVNDGNAMDTLMTVAKIGVVVAGVLCVLKVKDGKVGAALLMAATLVIGLGFIGLAPHAETIATTVGDWFSGWLKKSA